jgi:hypothetical protein
MLPSLPRQPGKNQHDTAATLRRISNYTELHSTPLQHISQHSATGAHRDKDESSHSDADFTRSVAGQEGDVQTGIFRPGVAYWHLVAA